MASIKEQEEVNTKNPTIDVEEQTTASFSDDGSNGSVTSTSRNNKRKYVIGGAIVMLVGIAVATGVVFGTKANNSTSTSSASSIEEEESQPSEDPQVEDILPEPTIPTQQDKDEEEKWIPQTKVQELISTIALNNGNEFINVDSYQSKALSWLENENTLIDQYSDEKIIQRYSLACIFYATNGVANKFTNENLPEGTTDVPGWKFSTNWLTDTNECSWYGITCSDDVTTIAQASTKSASSFDNPEEYNQVVEIELYENRMTGVLPPEITLLGESLHTLDLGMNEFLMGGVDVEDSTRSTEEEEQGNPIIPNNEWIGGLTELRRLFYPFNKFMSETGIPTEIGLLTKLEEYDCAFNIYRGALRGEIFDTTPLISWLDISGGFFQSSIPEQILNLPDLQDFFITDSFIVDDVSYLTSLTNIVQHVADSNPDLSGTLPSGDLLSSDLALLSFSYCNLHGSIPTTFGNLPDMEKLYLNNNQMTGTVPSEIGQLSLLSEFEIQVNDITGTMPDEVCDNRNNGSELDLGMIVHLIADCHTNEVECPLETCCTSCGPQYYH